MRLIAVASNESDGGEEFNPEIQEVIDIAPDSDETIDVPQLIIYDDMSILISIRALKLEYTTSELINEDLYPDLSLIDRERKYKHLRAKIMTLEIQNARDDVLSDQLDDHKPLQKARFDRCVSRLTDSVAPKSKTSLSRSPEALPRFSRVKLIARNKNHTQSYHTISRRNMKGHGKGEHVHSKYSLSPIR